jgi:glycosyltransferase involved in cell wall biosynthesis
MKSNKKPHAFVIPAYGESAYLSACIKSLVGQTIPDSEIVLTTSTPSDFVEKIALQYGIRLAVNSHRDGIASDWNFALNVTSAEVVTIAHQDDLYYAEYCEQLLGAMAQHENVSIAFSNCTEHTPAGPRNPSINLHIKRLLCSRVFGTRNVLEQPKEKRRLLTLGNPICCPSVIFNRNVIPDFKFLDGMKSNLDWEAWARLAELPGKFIYVKTPLVSKQVHDESETSALIANRQRSIEDRQMFNRFWPGPVAAAIAAAYRLGYIANRV